MTRHSLFPTLLLAVAATLALNVPAGADDQKPLVLEKFGVMYVGGREEPMAGGGRFGGEQTQIVEQAPVHYLIPPQQRSAGKLPVIMVPGMGLTSSIYLNTPDGRPGWATLFAKAGHPVYVVDEPNNANAGFPVSGFNSRGGDAAAEPTGRFMLWGNEMVWRRWGIGSAPGEPFADTQFPVEHIDQLYASMTPVYSTGGGRGGGGNRGAAGGRRGGRGRGGQTIQRGEGGRGANVTGEMQLEVDAAADAPAGRGPRGGRPAAAAKNEPGPKAKALIELLEKTGPAVLIVHSMAGQTGWETTRLRPDLVKAIVAVETVGSPTVEADVRKHFRNTYYLGVYGDHFETRSMAGRRDASATTAELIKQAGGQADMIWLPELGIHGNTHLLMIDRNNADIAEMILERLPEAAK